MSKIARTIKNVTNGYSSSQVKVRNATSNGEESPSTQDMQELAELTYQNHELFLIMDMLDKRLNDKGKYWRHVVKALMVLDYLVHYGSDNVIIWCRENLYIIKSLREFQYRDDSGRDQGNAIRQRAKELTSLLLNTSKLYEVRSRARGGRGGRRAPRNYDDEEPDRYRSQRPRERSRPTEETDEDLQRAIELSKQSVLDDERRRAQLASASTDDVNKAIQLSQSANRQIPQGMYGDGNLIDTSDSVYYQQPQMESVQTGYLQYSTTGALYSDADLQQYHLAQQQYQQQQQEMQAQYDAQQQQLAQLQAQHQALLQQQQYQQQQLQPLKTGSNNPFAAFNQQQQQQQQQPVAQAPTATGSQPRLRRSKSFNQEHMDQLDQILSLEAPSDTFGNTGSSRIPAQHTSGYMVNSAGHGLTSQMTGQRTGQGAQQSNNPFAAQYTGIATTQMQPSHTGYGFGNANATAGRSSSNLIDL